MRMTRMKLREMTTIVWFIVTAWFVARRLEIVRKFCGARDGMPQGNLNGSPCNFTVYRSLAMQ